MNRSKSAAILVVLAAAHLGAQAAPPGTDIYLAPLRVQGDRIAIGTPVNITKRPGYDNQPWFTSDGRAILFTSIREDRQADIYRYDLASKNTTQVTSTPESEYSATIMPGGNRFSVIRVEKDSAQRLWSFALDGSDPRVEFERVRPVGYHVWVSPDAAVLFVLGAGRDASALVWADRSGRADTLARDIGRSLVSAGGSGFSFVQRMPDSTWHLRVGGSKRPTSAAEFIDVTAMPSGADFVFWLDANRILSAAGSRLLLWERAKKSWTTVADLGSNGISGLSRLAVSPDQKWVAFVANEPRP
jgi:hypothetical protein